MIVSDNGTFLNMDGPKRGTSLRSMVTRPNDSGALFSKKVRYQSQLKDEGVLLEGGHFKAWRSKFDQLKQVVRQPRPTELHIHKSKFEMSKRRPAGKETDSKSLGGGAGADSIQSSGQNVGDEQSASRDPAEQTGTAMLSQDVPDTGDYSGGQHAGDDSAASSDRQRPGHALGEDTERGADGADSAGSPGPPMTAPSMPAPSMQEPEIH